MIGISSVHPKEDLSLDESHTFEADEPEDFTTDLDDQEEGEE